MEFKCVKADLHNAIQIVEKAVSLRSTLPIIGNILLEATGSGLKLSSNDLEIGIELLIEANIGQEGAVLAPAKKFSESIAKLPDGEVSVKIDKSNNILITSGPHKVNIFGLATDDFPVLHKLNGGEKINIEAEVLREMISQTIIAVSLDEAKQFLNGILVEKEKNELRFIATDGFRLAKKTTTLRENNNVGLSIIVPSRAMQEISRILQQEDYQGVVEIVVTKEQISFKFKSVYFISRLIQGQFPDYRQVIPKEQKTKITMLRKDLLQASEIASIIARDSANIIRLEMVDQKLLITANTSAIGNTSGLMDVQKEGDNMQPISFNVRLILDVIKNIDEDSVLISLNGPLSPGVITPKEKKDFTYVVMPIRTAENK